MMLARICRAAPRAKGPERKQSIDKPDALPLQSPAMANFAHTSLFLAPKGVGTSWEESA